MAQHETDNAALIRAAAGANSVIMPSSDESLFFVFESVEASAGASKRNSERNRAQQLNTVYEQYNTPAAQVEVIQDYRARIPEFERQLFVEKIRILLTEVKAELERPAAEGLDDETFERLRKRILPPYNYFAKRVNEERADGSIAGSVAVAESLLTHWFEGGMVGHRMAMATRSINSVPWRVPKSFLTYGVRQLSYDQKLSDGRTERWFANGGTRLGRNFTVKQTGIPLWDRPNEGIYAGVIKPGHPVGSMSAWPTPPYLAALDSCLMLEMHTRGELHSLTSMDRTIVMWTIDLDKLAAQGLSMSDSTDAEGNTVKGFASLWKEAREARRENPGMAMVEYTIGDFVKPVTFQPGMEFLQIAGRTLPSEIRIALFAGLRFDPDGNYIQEETERSRAVDFDHWRENVIEPVFQQEVFDPLTFENRRWWPTEFGPNPFVYVSDKARQFLAGRPSTISGFARRYAEEIALRLDGEICELRMLAKLKPSGNRPNSRLEELINLGRMGYIGPTFLQEAVGADPELTRADMYRMKNDLLKIQVDKMPVLSAPASNVQQSTSNGETSQTASRQSPGRMTGTKDSEPRETSPAAE